MGSGLEGDEGLPAIDIAGIRLPATVGCGADRRVQFCLGLGVKIANLSANGLLLLNEGPRIVIAQQHQAAWDIAAGAAVVVVKVLKHPQSGNGKFDPGGVGVVLRDDGEGAPRLAPAQALLLAEDDRVAAFRDRDRTAQPDNATSDNDNICLHNYPPMPTMITVTALSQLYG